MNTNKNWEQLSRGIRYGIGGYYNFEIRCLGKASNKNKYLTEGTKQAMQMSVGKHSQQKKVSKQEEE